MLFARDNDIAEVKTLENEKRVLCIAAQTRDIPKYIRFIYKIRTYLWQTATQQSTLRHHLRVKE